MITTRNKIVCWSLLLFGLLGCKNERAELSKATTNKLKMVSNDLLNYVDPFIGTGFHGHTFPGATTPFGMVQLSPDTRLPGWDASSGYHYSDNTIYGFSHTHLSGTGIGDMGDILFLPFTGEVQDSMVATFDKAEESAKAAYYSVRLENYGVTAELTATPRTGLHRYSYPAGEEQLLKIDLAHILQANWGHKSMEGALEFVNEQTIRGKRVSSGWAFDHPVYFYATFSRPYEVKKITGADSQTDSTATGKDLRAFISFGNASQQALHIKVGISSVSMEGARKNLQVEVGQKNFNQVRSIGEQAWRKELQKIEITTADEDLKKNFYSALYHCMMSPMLAQDVDGYYRGIDKQVHLAENGYVNYTVFSLWDTFRGFHPLMSIIDEERTNQWVKSLLRKYEQGGVLPKWPLAANYTGTMVGYPATAVIADAMAKGIGNFDKKLALEAAVFSSEYHPEVINRLPEPRAKEVMPKHLDYIQKKGYSPADLIPGSVSYGVECAYYDWCIAEIASIAGDLATAQKYFKRSKYYQNYYDASTGFMRPKLNNGQWKETFSPRFSDHAAGDYIEGNAWQWSWFVPHDVPGMMELMGGKDQFAGRLDELFTTSSEIEGEDASADITGLIGQYAHGNEPSHHITHLYNYTNQPWKTQERVDEVLQNLYAPTPAGISGNEDCGQMSAWYVLNVLGFYPVCPGEAKYSIGRPLVDSARVQLRDGSIFYVEVENNSKENKYVRDVRINDKRLTQAFFGHDDIKGASKLIFTMGDAPMK